MNIRQEQPDEFGKIYELVQTAFQTAKVSDGTEQDFVNKLREGNGYLPQLALVAEENGELIGHIMLTKCPVVNGQEAHEILLLAPLSVRLEYRNRGVGSALIAECARLAREMGYSAIILVTPVITAARDLFPQLISASITPMCQTNLFKCLC